MQVSRASFVPLAHVATWLCCRHSPREGLERQLHSFAFGYPILYGLMTVTIAIAAGFLASTVFRKPT
jgi:hypothetical protein